MARRPRKGIIREQQPNVVELRLPPEEPGRKDSGEGAAPSDPFYFWNVWNAGHGIVQRFPVDLRRFSDVPIIADNVVALWRERFAGMSPSTCDVRKKELSRIVNFIDWYAAQFNKRLDSADSVDKHVLNQFIISQATQDTVEASKAVAVRAFNRFLDEVGAPPYLRVAQAFSGAPDSAVKDVISPRDARRILNQCKAEIRVVQSRVREAHRLAARGHDPRRSSGGHLGDWASPECRAWVIKRLLKRELHKYDKMRFEMGLNTILRGLEGRPAAECVQADGTIARQGGWLGHIRWFMPFGDDIGPFAVLIMLRLGWNLTTVAALRTRRWCELLPFGLDEHGSPTHVNIVSVKVRGKDGDSEAKIIKAPVPKRPSTYPYRLLKFVDYWTVGLRKEVHRMIKELQAKEFLLPEEKKELWRLERIKDDLFIYMTKGQITSLRDMEDRSLDRMMKAFMKRAGCTVGARELRDAPLLFTYEASGQNLFVVQMLADHSSPNITVQYVRRRRTLLRVWEQFLAVFSASLKLIEQDSFSIAELRKTLRAQGFSDAQANNLLDPATRSRWGNGCADPDNPPPGFDGGRKPGHGCTGQDCIDGCPYARWFNDSIQHVANELVVAERRRDSVGLETSLASTLDERISRCKTLLAQWPEGQMEAALKLARDVIPEFADGFLGAALGEA